MSSATLNVGGSTSLETMTLPSNRQLKTCYDTGGKPLSVTGSKNSANSVYASSTQYADFGALKQLDLGNGFRETPSFNAHQQTENILVNKPSIGINYLSLTNYHCTNSPGTQDCSFNNGNVMRQDIQHANGYNITKTFGYDKANRLTSAVEAPAGGTGWNQTYNYDQ